MTLESGRIVLDRYEVEALLGEGGMGQVYRGRHTRLGMPVALKILTDRTAPGMESRFEREAMLMARVRHANVVQILDFGFLEEGTPCIAMELVAGDAIDSRLKKDGALPWPSALRLALGVLSGLEAMHQAGVLHRDLKPANVLAVPGPPESAKLIDFGIAQPTGEDAARLTRTGMVIGTPAYMAPEQLLCAPLDARTDVYAAGLLLWEMLAGKLPHGPNDLRAVMQRLQQPMPPPRAPEGRPEIPEAVLECLAAALDSEPERRPATARGFAAQLVTAAREARAKRSTPPGAPAPEPAVAADDSPPPPRSATEERSAFGTAPTLFADLPAGDAGPRGAPSGPGTGPGAAGAGAGAAVEMRRYVVAAKLPPSLLARKETRQRLAEMTGTQARSYALGSAYWFAVSSALRPEPEAKRSARELADKLRGEYGETTKVRWGLVDESFRFSAAALTGASPMPEALGKLLRELS